MITQIRQIKHRRNKGVALVIVLWISVILSAIAVTISYTARLEVRRQQYAAKEMQLLAANMAAAERLKAELLGDNGLYTSLKGNWRNPLGKEPLAADIAVTATVEDEEGKINLNSSSAEILKKFFSGLGAPNADEMADSLLDYTGTNKNARPLGGKDPYYLSLNPPRKCKNAPLDCVEELSMVKGFGDAGLRAKIERFSTVSSDGKIDVNTAPLEVLTALPKVDYLVGQAIIARRNGKDLLQGTADDLPYDTALSVRDAVDQDVYSAIETLITVRSADFKITAKASSGRYSKTIVAVLSKQGKDVRKKYWKEN
jgi:general secretion pathway protein K